MKTTPTDGIVADGADRLRKAIASKTQHAGAAGKSFSRRITLAIRRLLGLPSIPERDSSDEGPSPYSLFGTRPKDRRVLKTSVQEAGASGGDKSAK